VNGELERALEIIADLLALIDRKFLQIAWLEGDSQAVTAARAFLLERGSGDLSER
jgi:hypothetical protein